MKRKMYFSPLIEIISMEEDDVLMSDFFVEGDYDYYDAEWLD